MACIDSMGDIERVRITGEVEQPVLFDRLRFVLV